MHRLVISVFIFAAFSQVAVCDLNCFLEKDLNNSKVFPDKVTGFTIKLCRPFREYFEATRVAAKECNLRKIEVTEALAFTKDICTVGWDLSNQYQDHQKCFGDNLMPSFTCAQTISANLSSFGESAHSTDDWKTLLVAVCENIEDIYTCFNEKMGNPCGENGTALVKKLTTALSSFTTGLCKEVNGAPTISAVSWTVLLAIFFFVLNLHKY